MGKVAELWHDLDQDMGKHWPNDWPGTSWDEGQRASRARGNGKQVLDITRELIAYSLIGLVVVVAVPWIGVTFSRRKREKLRRRGIKTFGH